MRMFTIGAAALALTLSSAVASASIVATENFSGYTVGALDGQGSAAGSWTGEWYASTARALPSASNRIKVQAASNTFSPDYPSAAGGQSAAAGFERSFRPLTATTGKTYVSFVGAANLLNQFNLNITNDTDNSRIAAFQWGTIPADPVAGTPAQTGHQVNYFNGNVATIMNNDPNADKYESYSPLGITSASDNDLYVITLDPATNEVGYFVFLSGTSPLTGTASYGLTIINDATRGASFDRVGLFSIYSVGISDIRIGTTPEDVGVSPNALVAVPEPASLGLLALGGLALLRRRR